MKKKISIIFAVLATLMLTGCGEVDKRCTWDKYHKCFDAVFEFSEEMGSPYTFEKYMFDNVWGYEDDEGIPFYVQDYLVEDGFATQAIGTFKCGYSKKLNLYQVTWYVGEPNLTWWGIERQDEIGQYTKYAEKAVYYLDTDFNVIAYDQHIYDGQITYIYPCYKLNGCLEVEASFGDEVNNEYVQWYLKEFKKDAPPYVSY